MLSLPLYLQRIHNREFERNLLHLQIAYSYAPLTECSLGIHSMFSLLFLTVNVHHKQPQQVTDFSLFLHALYLLWNNFLISEVTSKHMNNTTKNLKETCTLQGLVCRCQNVHLAYTRFSAFCS